MKKLSLKNKKVWVTGHSGMLGSAICRQLNSLGHVQILTISHKELDLTSLIETEQWISKNKPDLIIHCAALVGGIEANKTKPVEFLNTNLTIGLNIINSAAKFGVEKLVNFGSSCFYPKDSVQPIVESALLTGALEPTNEAYALAKITQMKLCEFYREQYGHDFITIVPTNLFGPGDNFDPVNGHVIASLINKFVHAKNNNLPSVELWGTGKPEREFMFVDDAAHGIIMLTENYSSKEQINLCGGESISMLNLATLIKDETLYLGQIKLDQTKPDGMMKKSLDASKLQQFKWEPSTTFKQALHQTVNYYLKQSIKNKAN